MNTRHTTAAPHHRPRSRRLRDAVDPGQRRHARHAVGGRAADGPPGRADARWWPPSPCARPIPERHGPRAALRGSARPPPAGTPPRRGLAVSGATDRGGRPDCRARPRRRPLPQREGRQHQRRDARDAALPGGVEAPAQHTHRGAQAQPPQRRAGQHAGHHRPRRHPCAPLPARAPKMAMNDRMVAGLDKRQGHGAGEGGRQARRRRRHGARCRRRGQPGAPGQHEQEGATGQRQRHARALQPGRSGR